MHLTQQVSPEKDGSRSSYRGHHGSMGWKDKKITSEWKGGEWLVPGICWEFPLQKHCTCPEFHLLGLWDNLFLGHSDKSVLSLRMAVNNEETFF